MLNRRSTLASLLLLGPSAYSQPSAASFDPTLPAKAAEAAVRVMAQVNGTKLDYSAESLRSVDSFVLAIRATDKDGTKFEHLLNVLGFYVGEVMARGYQMQWVKPTDAEAKLGAPAYALRHPSGSLVNPIGKVFKLFQNGEEDRTHGLYTSLESLLSQPPR